MSDSESPTASVEPPETSDPSPLRRSASYMGCRHCEEGNLVYDPAVGASRCHSCGKLD